MDEYYGNTPKKIPFAPIAITGFNACQSHLVASMISQLTGLPLIDLDQWIEHKMGKSILKVILEEGESHLRAREGELLPKVLRTKPPGIIALGDGTLINEANQDLVNEFSILVYVYYDVQNLLNLLKKDTKRCPQKFPILLINPASTIDDLRSLLETRLPGYQRADYSVNGAGKSIVSLAKYIIDTLGL